MLRKCCNVGLCHLILLIGLLKDDSDVGVCVIEAGIGDCAGVVDDLRCTPRVSQLSSTTGMRIWSGLMRVDTLFELTVRSPCNPVAPLTNWLIVRMNSTALAEYS